MKSVPNRPRSCRGRSHAWSRHIHREDRTRPDSPAVAISYWLFQRDSTGKTYVQQQTFGIPGLIGMGGGARNIIAGELRAMRAQLRWAIDQVEFARLGLQDTTPPPLGAPAQEMNLDREPDSWMMGGMKGGLWRAKVGP